MKRIIAALLMVSLFLVGCGEVAATNTVFPVPFEKCTVIITDHASTSDHEYWTTPAYYSINGTAITITGGYDTYIVNKLLGPSPSIIPFNEPITMNDRWSIKERQVTK